MNRALFKERINSYEIYEVTPGYYEEWGYYDSTWHNTGPSEYSVVGPRGGNHGKFSTIKLARKYIKDKTKK